MEIEIYINSNLSKFVEIRNRNAANPNLNQGCEFCEIKSILINKIKIL